MVKLYLIPTLVSIVAISSITDAFHPVIFMEDTISKHLQKLESQHPTEDTVVVDEEWFKEQILDHTSCGAKQYSWIQQRHANSLSHTVNGDCEPKYWKQRYFVNSQFYKGPGSPVFLLIRGENVASADVIASKFMYIVHEAEKYGAMVVALEHRFYGQSQPTPDMSTENLQYLTSDQALADIANFQAYFVTSRNMLPTSPWVAFGGSYPGMLAAWAKYRFPDRFVGSIASSAPIDIKADFYGYMDVVARNLRIVGGPACTNTLQRGLKQFHALVASDKPEDLAKLNKLFNPCTPIESDLDRMAIEAYVMLAYMDFGLNFDPIHYRLRTACNDLTAKDGLTPLEKVAKINSRKNAECTYSNYQSSFVNIYSDTATDTVNVSRQWTFQTCNEFGFAQTAAKSTGPFSELKYITVDRVYYQMCKDVFGITDTDARIAAKRANYHGLDINVGNVVFTTGTFDPWSALAVTNDTKLANPTSKVVYIEGASHCDDFYSPTPFDLPSLQWAHQQIDAAIASFIKK